MYESELSEARRLLDELSKEKAQLQIEAASFREKAESEKNRYGYWRTVTFFHKMQERA